MIYLFSCVPVGQLGSIKVDAPGPLLLPMIIPHALLF